MTFKFKAETRGEHTHVAVYCGGEGKTKAHCGKLTFRGQEWAAFRTLLIAGNVETKIDTLEFEEK